MDLERLVISATDAEFRLEDTNKGRKLVGYFAVYNSRSVDLGGFVEICKPGAFNRNFNSGVDVRSLKNHDKNLILGRTTAGTLRLSGNNKGGISETDIDMEISYARDLLRSIERGDITGMSFGFRTISDSWRVQDGINIRELTDVTLDNGDTSPVTYPAYPATSINVRSEIKDPDVDGNALAAVLIRLDKKLELQERDSAMVMEYRSAIPGRFEPFIHELLKVEKRGLSLDIARRKIELLQAELAN